MQGGYLGIRNEFPSWAIKNSKGGFQEIIIQVYIFGLRTKESKED